MMSFTMVGRPDPCFAWDGASVRQALPAELLLADDGSGRRPPAFDGAFAELVVADGGVAVVRDPLGLDKLFWAEQGGRIELASRPSLLIERGHRLEDCSSFPADVCVTYRGGSSAPLVEELAPVPDPAAASVSDLASASFEAGSGAGARPGPDGESDQGSVEQIARRIRDTVGRYVAAVLAERPGPVIVCLSGGLDSTSVAALVREHRDDAVAVTFDLARATDGGGRGVHGVADFHGSDDLQAATEAARHLGLTLHPAIHDPGRLLDLLDDVLVAGIDWRDFNVHAGLVNAGLAVSIAELLGAEGRKATVFTGDLVNEFLADYHTETYKAETYYRLPRLPLAKIRSVLVQGLATAHREIGVFGRFGLQVVQPYAVAHRDFLQLPADLLGTGPGKRTLYSLMFGDALPRSTYDRPKTRAQTGSEDGEGGVLAACVDAGIDGPWLANRFGQLHGGADAGALRRFLYAGRYRTAIPRGEGEGQREGEGDHGPSRSSN